MRNVISKDKAPTLSIQNQITREVFAWGKKQKLGFSMTR